MKKLLSIILAAVLWLTFISCGDKEDQKPDGSNVPTSYETPTPDAPDTAETEETAREIKNIIPAVSADTVGGKIWDIFYTAVTSDPNVTALDLAEDIASAGIVPYALGGLALSDLASPDAEGKLYLQGFGGYDFAGLDTENSAIFLPTIGSTPFIGYIFELADGADAESFIKNLEENANLRWQICVSAGQMVTGSVGNKVFFIMCPLSVDGQPSDSDDAFPGMPMLPGIQIG